MSMVRQNFCEACEVAINHQINMELYACYVYLSMTFYFDREDVALAGAHAYFKQASGEEMEHATKLMNYLNKRGGRIMLTDIMAPSKQDWGTLEDAMKTALQLERDVNQSLLDLHAKASDAHDANLCDFLETEFLQEQVEASKELAHHITNLRRVGAGLGVYEYDRALEKSVKEKQN